MANRLQHETSPYLRQHAENPVNWYPWGKEAFEQAAREDKPVFLSIGYSTCHWCHVMARESFEDETVAELLNRSFISIKVDREERPDIDHIYMRVCEAFTGGGGWPTSIFMTADQKPFFAGTYYPPRNRRGMIGFTELLTVIREKWETDRASLWEQSEEIASYLRQTEARDHQPASDLIETAVSMFRRSFDRERGGFGGAPKFPAAHQLLFLMACAERFRDAACQDMADQTLLQMYRGGLFDHIGGGFSRYSTDDRFLVPHFEKMLYDNALLISAYARANAMSGDAKKAALFLRIAERTANFVLREMTEPRGGFYSARDADSEGEEGKYYLFSKEEIEKLLPKETADAFCRRFDITGQGNFKGKNIPNLLNSDPLIEAFPEELKALYAYRKDRYPLHTDEKILTAWNGLMIGGLCDLYRESGNEKYLSAAQSANCFIRDQLLCGEALFTGYTAGQHSAWAFLDDYAACCYADLKLYQVTLRREYLDAAEEFCQGAQAHFSDPQGGFFFTADTQEKLLMRTKEFYDGAMPSGNSLMAWNLVRLSELTGREDYCQQAKRQLDFLASQAAAYPTGHAMYLLARLEYEHPAPKVLIVSDHPEEASAFPFRFSSSALLSFQTPSDTYPLLKGQTTYYFCDDHSCRPPTTSPEDLPVFG